MSIEVQELVLEEQAGDAGTRVVATEDESVMEDLEQAVLDATDLDKGGWKFGGE